MPVSDDWRQSSSKFGDVGEKQNDDTKAIHNERSYRRRVRRRRMDGMLKEFWPDLRRKYHKNSADNREGTN